MSALRERLKRAAARRIRIAGAARRSLSSSSRSVALFHEFGVGRGGAHQFLRALSGELERHGFGVENNVLSRETPACLLNSFNFDPDLLRAPLRLRGLQRSRPRVVHRVDGPLLLYRGFDDRTDAIVRARNREFADATIFQSQASLDAHRELGFELVAPLVIPNAPDPRIFHPGPPKQLDPHKIRLISVSWSDNPNKGGSVYAELDRLLDWSRFGYTFVGRVQHPFRNIHQVGVVASDALAGILREHDVFITASVNDPCSNALIEALACGLPTLYARSGGHPELVGGAGLGFDDAEEIPALLDSLVGDYDAYRSRIELPSLAEVAARYRVALGVDHA